MKTTKAFPEPGDRIIGRKSILPLMEAMYDIHTWSGALRFIRRHHLPLRRTPSNRPMFLKHELLGYDIRFQGMLEKFGA